MCEWKKVFPVGIRRGDPNLSNSYRLIPVHRQMMAVEAVKENFYCFLGIVHPTYYQSRGWGPWLGNTLSSQINKKSIFYGLFETPPPLNTTNIAVCSTPYNSCNTSPTPLWSPRPYWITKGTEASAHQFGWFFWFFQTVTVVSFKHGNAFYLRVGFWRNIPGQ